MTGQNWMFMHTSKPGSSPDSSQIFRRWGIDDDKLRYLAISTEHDEKNDIYHSLGWLQTAARQNDGQIRAFFPEGFLSLNATDTDGKEEDNEVFCKTIPKENTRYSTHGRFLPVATGPLINSGSLPSQLGIEELGYLSQSDQDGWTSEEEEDDNEEKVPIVEQ